MILWYLLTAVVIVAGFVYWQSDLRSDPPMYYSGIGQSLATDPAQYIFHARNKIEFGQFDPFSYGRWTVYQHSFVSLVGYIWFSIAGISLEQSAMVGVLLSFGSLLLLLFGVRRHHRPWVLPALSLCYLINVTLFTYGQLSYLENGLIFIGSAIFAVYSRWGNKTWGVIVCGMLASSAMLTGKLFGVLFLPALLMADLTGNSANKMKRAIVTIISFSVASIILMLTLYGTDISSAIGYLTEQSYSLRGFPEGLTGILPFFEHLISYGFANHLFYLNPDLLIMFALSTTLLIQYRPQIASLSPSVRFSFFWISFFFLGLMPLNYSPLRYAITLIPAILIFGLTVFDNMTKSTIQRLEKPKKWQFVTLSLVFWFVLFHSIGNIFFLQTMPRPITLLTWSTLPVAIGIAWFASKLLIKQTNKTAHRSWMVALVAVLVVPAISNPIWLNEHHHAEQNYNIAEANADLSAILNEGAVVSGPYGPILTIDTKIASFIHLFQVAQVDKTLFDRNPITHIAVDISNIKEAVKNYPKLGEIKPVTKYWIRDVEVGIFRVAGFFNNLQANQYKPSRFEQAITFYNNGEIDSALVATTDVYSTHPESKSAGLLLSELYLRKKEYQNVHSLLVTLANRFPTDFNIQLQCGRFLQILSYKQKNQTLLAHAQTYYANAVKVNRYKAGYAMQMWSQTANQARQGSMQRQVDIDSGS